MCKHGIIVPVMTEDLTPQNDHPRWSPEIEAEVRTGAMTPLEADEFEHPTVVKVEMDPDQELDRELERLIDHGFSRGVAEKMVGIKSDETPKEKRSAGNQRTRPGYTKDGSRRRIKTPADARAADRLPDDEWRYR